MWQERYRRPMSTAVSTTAHKPQQDLMSRKWEPAHHRLKLIKKETTGRPVGDHIARLSNDEREALEPRVNSLGGDPFRTAVKISQVEILPFSIRATYALPSSISKSKSADFGSGKIFDNFVHAINLTIVRNSQIPRLVCGFNMYGA